MNNLWRVLVVFAVLSLLYIPAGAIERIRGREPLSAASASVVGALEGIVWLLFLYYLWFSR